jgi:hypothetical protein
MMELLLLLPLLLLLLLLLSRSKVAGVGSIPFSVQAGFQAQ